MTNGEKLCIDLPNATTRIFENKIFHYIEVDQNDKWMADINIEWWNSEYKEPTTPNDCETCIHNKGVLECDMYGCKYESTTKNDLAVDAVSRQAINGYIDYILSHGMGKQKSFEFIKKFVTNLPPVTPQLSSGLEKNSKKLESIATPKDDLGVDYLGVDCISRKAVQTRLKEIINEMETIFADIREREVDDSVCGLCEYDCDHGLDGFANECPGFEKDDCFKLNEKYRAEWLDISNLPSVTPIRPKGHWIECMPGGAEEWCYKCSECNFWKYKKTINLSKFSFCPNCGSDNREVEE